MSLIMDTLRPLLKIFSWNCVKNRVLPNLTFGWTIATRNQLLSWQCGAEWPRKRLEHEAVGRPAAAACRVTCDVRSADQWPLSGMTQQNNRPDTGAPTLVQHKNEWCPSVLRCNGKFLLTRPRWWVSQSHRHTNLMAYHSVFPTVELSSDTVVGLL